MFRKVFVVFIMILCMGISGCATLQEVNNLKQENETVKSIVQDKLEEIDQLNQQVASLNQKIESMKAEQQATLAAKTATPSLKDQPIPEKETVNSSPKDPSIPVKEKEVSVKEKLETSVSAKQAIQEVKAPVAKKETAQTTTVEKAGAPKAKVLKLKVLHGGTNAASAKEVAEKLKKLGYSVGIIGTAPRSNFDKTTIYFAQDYKKEAQQVAAQLGGGVIIKPLTWDSVFHMIVVTGP